MVQVASFILLLWGLIVVGARGSLQGVARGDEQEEDVAFHATRLLTRRSPVSNTHRTLRTKRIVGV